MAKSVEELQTLLDLAEAYLETKKVKLNASKTEIVIFYTGKPNGQHDLSFTHKGKSIKVAPRYKYLGNVLAAKPQNCAEIKVSGSGHNYASGYVPPVSLKLFRRRQFIGLSSISIIFSAACKKF